MFFKILARSNDQNPKQNCRHLIFFWPCFDIYADQCIPYQKSANQSKTAFSICSAQSIVGAVLWQCVAFDWHFLNIAHGIILIVSFEFELGHKRISLSEFAGSMLFLDRVLIRQRRLKPNSTLAFSALNWSNAVAILDKANLFGV